MGKRVFAQSLVMDRPPRDNTRLRLGTHVLTRPLAHSFIHSLRDVVGSWPVDLCRASSRQVRGRSTGVYCLVPPAVKSGVQHPTRRSLLFFPSCAYIPYEVGSRPARSSLFCGPAAVVAISLRAEQNQESRPGCRRGGKLKSHSSLRVAHPLCNIHNTGICLRPQVFSAKR